MEETKEKQEQNNNTNNTGCIIALIIFAIFIYIIWKGISGLFSVDESVSNGDIKDYRINAYVMSQDFIEDYLVSPSTADFPSYSAINVIQTGNRYKVEAYVDSQNLLGGTVRTNYYMILERSEDGGWYKISCDIK